ncbi:MAG: cation:proton antiporter [Candidatus Pacearchaeota archaeon]
MELILTIAIIIAISLSLKLIAKNTNIPSVVVLIAGGLIIGVPSIKQALIEPNTEIVLLLGKIGLFCLMFLAGMETSWRKLYKEKKDATAIAIAGAIMPFLLGFIVLLLIGVEPWIAATTGVIMSVTAEATKARVLLELKKLKTKVGSAMMGAGIIDDLIGLTVFTAIAFINNFQIEENLVTLGIIAAFFAGLGIRNFLKREHFLKTTEHALFLIVPFFFISIGLHFEFSALVLSPLIILAIVILGFAGKMAGPLLSKHYTDFNYRQLYLVGWAMNSRGAVGLGLAVIALQQGLIGKDIYSGLVIMALLTTLTFPFVIRKIVNKNPKIMNKQKK